MRVRRTLTAAAGLLAASALALAGCASPAPEDDAAPAAEETADQFPITIEHALGTTTIEEAPTRVATWGWGSTEAAIASGVFPVAVAEQVWTVGEDALLPWVETAYEEAGEELPVILDDSAAGEEVPYEQFAEVDPDLIIATYSGLTEEQYELLEEIAPVVAYPEAPWTTPWDDNITLTAQALGRSEAGEEVLTAFEDYAAGIAAEHPEFEGKTIAAIVDDPQNGQIFVYNSSDPRAGFLEKLGFTTAPAVDELDPTGGEDFFYTLSYEELDKLESDVVVAYTYTEEQAEALPDSKELGALPALQNGMVAQVVGTVNVSSVSPPTALSYDWPEGVPALAEDLGELLG
ncbi:iron-siderophore ABC transporter substrate-binding protein [Myceligenerans pegani]|uniref:Iron-siderophore ABC transporter substrate-binding protein n=1 Tax=Myceligenerans pegani TaxID=2776917 RepID=A0ABR9N2E2_9MICO|nr:iron-siderophore ABC transporter substrate-binding protein [Myceligenerans sp. TRM 65318]MBE1877815.1 iron-siderophore ABC transporter substrate-binding protein [Myceligenerans sp. TRM 65318]MBE3020086.1 iron-siderophore ABC transporter substrate-binding protein [Myceligenerans sp. TRM 65318]